MYSDSPLYATMRFLKTAFVDLPIAFWAMLSSISVFITETVSTVLAMIDSGLANVGAEVACRTETAIKMVFASAYELLLPVNTALFNALPVWG